MTKIIKPIPKDTNRELLKLWLENDIHHIPYEIVGDTVEFMIEDGSSDELSMNHYDKIWTATYPDNVVLFPFFKNEEMLANWMGIDYNPNDTLEWFRLTEHIERYVMSNKLDMIEILKRNTEMSSISDIYFSEFLYVSKFPFMDTVMNISSECIAIVFDDYSEQVKFVLQWGDARHAEN